MPTTPITWDTYSDGQLRRTPSGTWRTATPDGRFTASGHYHRHHSRERFAPPYTLRARVKVHHRLSDPWIVGEQRNPTWDHGFCVHPWHDGNRENWVTRFWNVEQRLTIAAEHDGRYLYPWNNGQTIHVPNPQLGVWHDLEVAVPDYGHVRYTWNGITLLDRKASVPTAHHKPGQIGFRLDFFDVELDDVRVGHAPPPPTDGEPMNYTYRRSNWVGTQPVTGPLFTWSTVNKFVVHYRGTGTAGVPADIAQHLRNINASYWNRTPGYAIGYSAAVVSSAGHPLDGTTWECRGDTFRAAANEGHNLESFALLVIQVDNQQATPKAAAAIRDLVAQCRQRRPVTIVGHGQIGSTECPGVGLRAQITAGVFEPGGVTPPPPPPPLPPPPVTDPEDTAMLLDWRPGTTKYTGFAFDGFRLAWYESGRITGALLKGGAARVVVDDATLTDIINAAELTTKAPETLTPAMAAAWKAKRP